MNRFYSFFQYLAVFLFFYKKHKMQQRFYRIHFLSEIECLLSGVDNQYKNKLLKKTERYAIAIPVRLGEAYCLLRGAEMTLAERMAITCAGGLTGLFDDLFDENKISDQQILDFVKNKTSVTGPVDLKLIEFLYQHLLKNVQADTDLTDLIERVVQSQISSRRQFESSISNEEVKSIVAEKGGASLLFYRSAFAGSMSYNEEKMIFRLGALGQFVNDIFDVYSDFQDGIVTAANNKTRIEDLRKEFDQDVFLTLSLISESGFQKKSIERFRKIVIFILSGAYLCINNYEELQRRNGNRFYIPDFKRQDLICDMENSVTVFKLLKIATKLNKQFKNI